MEEPKPKINAGNFKHNPERARAMGKLGGSVSGGNFRNDPERARRLGSKGGNTPKRKRI